MEAFVLELVILLGMNAVSADGSQRGIDAEFSHSTAAEWIKRRRYRW